MVEMVVVVVALVVATVTDSQPGTLKGKSQPPIAGLKANPGGQFYEIDRFLSSETCTQIFGCKLIRKFRNILEHSELHIGTVPKRRTISRNFKVTVGRWANKRFKVDTTANFRIKNANPRALLCQDPMFGF